jgi:hypothetical protein
MQTLEIVLQVDVMLRTYLIKQTLVALPQEIMLGHAVLGQIVIMGKELEFVLLVILEIVHQSL